MLTHKNYLQQALDLAKIRRGFCAPNPSVGAVIVKNGEVIATGYHFAAGQPHAEIDALKKINNQAHDATIYVTLEPCCHFGKTPPCTEAIIKSGIKHVIYAYRDPNPVVAGKGEAALLAANIECQQVSLPEIDQFYKSYTYWQQTKKPFITAKIALTLDGKIAGKNNRPIPITEAPLNQYTHLNRKNSDAILTTAKTIIQDDPQLNARYQNETIPKPIYILDSQLTLPLTAQIFETAKSLTLFHAKNPSKDRLQALEALKVRCIPIDTNDSGLRLDQVIDFIGKDGIQDLWIEAGGQCFTTFADQNLLQKALIYIAPQAIGPEGLSAFNAPFDFRTEQIQWQQFGNDVLCEIHW